VQVANVADVQKVKISIGERDALARGPPFFHSMAKFFTAQNFIGCVQ
jgi:hypothetical protein